MSERRLTAYEWAEKRALSVSPQIVGEIFETIQERDGKLRPQAVVDEARAEDSPIHRYFEWNDVEAAEKYRLVQARTLIARLRVIPDDTHRPVPAFVSVEPGPEPEEPRGYIDVRTALTEDDTRQKVLDQAFRELFALERRFEALDELADVWSKVKELARQRQTRAASKRKRRKAA